MSTPPEVIAARKLNQVKAPFIYYGVKLLCGFYVVRLWIYRQKVFAQPEDLLEKILSTRNA